MSATEKKERLDTVTSSLASQVESQRNANIQAAAASSSYAKTLQQVGEAMKTVNDLHSKGQQVWDAQKKDFDYTTEAGRTAADSLTALAKENLANVVDSMSYLFPDGTRKQVKDILLNSIWQGKTDANQLYDMVQRLSDGKHTVVITGDNKLAIVAANDVTNAVMKVPALKKVYLKAITEGKSDTEALEESISSIPTMKDAFVKAKSEGKSDLDALRDAIRQVPEIKEAYLKATSSGKSEVDALRIALSLIPDVKNTDITATDNTQAGVASAQSSVNGVKQTSPTVIDAVDRASIIAQIAKGNIENVPRNWPTLFAGIGNTPAVAVDAKNQIVSVPTRWGSRL
ncbi:hypothetical protein ABG818_11045, partial [Bifidobacterium adolescentis]